MRAEEDGAGQPCRAGFIALLCKRTISIGIGLTVCELVLAPSTPRRKLLGYGEAFAKIWSSAPPRSDRQAVSHRDRGVVRELHILVDVFGAGERCHGGRR